jgi:biopolymer transport protein ExbD
MKVKLRLERIVPVKLGSKLPATESEARIEIVPLIDIMFFLLASFMLVSLSLVHLRTVKVALPTATTGTPDAARHAVDVTIDKAGGVFVDHRPARVGQLAGLLTAARQADAQVRVIISGDRSARHGDVLDVLDAVRAAGIDRVAFDVKAAR